MDITSKTIPASLKKITNHEFINQFDVVEDIHSLLKSRKYEEALPQIKQLCNDTKDINFPLNSGGYTRNILSKKDGFWLSLLNWDKDVITYPHGHPEQAFIYTVKGKIEVNNYELKTDMPLEPIGTEVFPQGEYFFSHGEKDSYDNAIHQISSKEQSITLHFYSDNPTKGTLYKN